MPADVIAFARRLYDSLPSQSFTFPDGKDASDYRARYRKEIANLGIKYIQMEEALGRPPKLEEIGEKFSHYCKSMPGSITEAWKVFVRCVNNLRNL